MMSPNSPSVTVVEIISYFGWPWLANCPHNTLSFLTLHSFCSFLQSHNTIVLGQYMVYKRKTNEHTKVFYGHKSPPPYQTGNNGGSRDPCSQKIFELTENILGNYRYFVAKMKFWQKLPLYCRENEMSGKIITIFITKMECCSK